MNNPLPVVILTGPAAAGKNTIAAAVAELVPAIAVVDVDVIRWSIVKPHVAPWGGDEGKRQQEIGVQNACDLLQRLSTAGFPTILLDVVTDRTAVIYRERFAHAALRVVRLLPEWGEIEARLLARTHSITVEEARLVYQWQQALTDFDETIDNTVTSAAEVAELLVPLLLPPHNSPQHPAEPRRIVSPQGCVHRREASSGERQSVIWTSEMTSPELDAFVAANRANWDARARVHANSAFYGVQRYVDDPSFVSAGVREAEELLAGLDGLDVLNLQCHIGTDSISLTRRGARVTGLDFSPESLRIADELAKASDADVALVCADSRTAHRVLERQFDLVYASVGILCWIPSVEEWVRAAASCIRPGGRLYLRDGHPIKDAFDYNREDDKVVLVGDYFGSEDPYRDDAGCTYTGDEVRLEAPVNFQWTHSMGAIVSALADAGLRIDRLEESDWMPWKAFPWMIEDGEHRWCFPPGHPRVPLMFTIVATRPRGEEV